MPGKNDEARGLKGWDSVCVCVTWASGWSARLRTGDLEYTRSHRFEEGTRSHGFDLHAPDGSKLVDKFASSPLSSRTTLILVLVNNSL
jgi:hypothetical protein